MLQVWEGRGGQFARNIRTLIPNADYSRHSSENRSIFYSLSTPRWFSRKLLFEVSYKRLSGRNSVRLQLLQVHLLPNLCPELTLLNKIGPIKIKKKHWYSAIILNHSTINWTYQQETRAVWSNDYVPNTFLQLELSVYSSVVHSDPHGFRLLITWWRELHLEAVWRNPRAWDKTEAFSSENKFENGCCLIIRNS